LLFACNCEVKLTNFNFENNFNSEVSSHVFLGSAFLVEQKKIKISLPPKLRKDTAEY